MVSNSLKIALLGGDGIGPEVVQEALKVLLAVSDVFGFSISHDSGLVGAAAVGAGQKPLPDDTLKLCLDSDAILFGAVGDPRYGDLPPDQLPERALLYLRKGLDLFANLRPVKPIPALADASSLKREVLEGVDILIVRELVSGLYFGQPRGYDKDENGRFAFNTMWYHENEVKRIGKVAFDAAMQRRKKLCSADKANALEAMQLWRETMTSIAPEWPEVELSHMYADNAAMQLVQNPRAFDVMVASNMFGDVLSDIGAQLTGSLGMLPSASLGGTVGLFEPVHGSAPDIAGKGIANPMAAIFSASLLLIHSKGMTEAADLIDRSVNAILDEGWRTRDLADANTPEGRILTTTEIGDRIAAKVREA
ncbi:MAG: 3-isopropylmalate dehydrogenase [Planctomycetes bacterium]|nr:3-isopropylmalate dehydrogenase [Planctomycetota bacterium]